MSRPSDWACTCGRPVGESGHCPKGHFAKEGWGLALWGHEWAAVAWMAEASSTLMCGAWLFDDPPATVISHFAAGGTEWDWLRREGP